VDCDVGVIYSSFHGYSPGKWNPPEGGLVFVTRRLLSVLSQNIVG
jgi:hypothetical protein